VYFVAVARSVYDLPSTSCLMPGALGKVNKGTAESVGGGGWP
jgi:hypothetical protein